MLGFCFRFSLKVPGSDTSCDDGDKKGFPFRCAAARKRDWLAGLAGWKLPASETGWLGGRRLGARGWLETARAGWGDVRCGADWACEAGWKPPASETGAVDARGGNRPRARLARWTLVTRGNRPRARLARWTLVTRANRSRARLPHAETARERDWHSGRS